MRGVLAGIEDAADVDMPRVEAFVGTSAGSIVGARLAAGAPAAPAAERLADGPGRRLRRRGGRRRRVQRCAAVAHGLARVGFAAGAPVAGMALAAGAPAIDARAGRRAHARRAPRAAARATCSAASPAGRRASTAACGSARSTAAAGAASCSARRAPRPPTWPTPCARRARSRGSSRPCGSAAASTSTAGRGASRTSTRPTPAAARTSCASTRPPAWRGEDRRMSALRSAPRRLGARAAGAAPARRARRARVARRRAPRRRSARTSWRPTAPPAAARRRLPAGPRARRAALTGPVRRTRSGRRSHPGRARRGASARREAVDHRGEDPRQPAEVVDVDALVDGVGELDARRADHHRRHARRARTAACRRPRARPATRGRARADLDGGRARACASGPSAGVCAEANGPPVQPARPPARRRAMRAATARLDRRPRGGQRPRPPRTGDAALELEPVGDRARPRRRPPPGRRRAGTAARARA